MSGEKATERPEPKKAPARKATKPATDEPAAPEPEVHRAAGWVDRGDGRGWELEE